MGACEFDTREEYHEEVVRLLRKNIELEEKDTKRMKEIERLRPFEQTAKKRKEDGRRSGHKGHEMKKRRSNRNTTQ